MNITYRNDVVKHDLLAIRKIVESSGFFSESEIEVAVELVQERLDKGRSSGYEFLFAEQNGKTVGYTCFGLIACTISSYDLYWIAMHDDVRGQGIGKELLTRTERLIAELGGTRIYIETSSRDQYRPTRKFYLSCNYREDAVLQDFYAPGDDKVMYVKAL